MSERRYPVVVVDWLDACRHDGVPVARLTTVGLVPATHVGFLVAKTKDSVSLMLGNFDGDSATVLVIPRSWVVKVRRLKE